VTDPKIPRDAVSDVRDQKPAGIYQPANERVCRIANGHDNNDPHLPIDSSGQEPSLFRTR
jgi:hypothetical protein